MEEQTAQEMQANAWCAVWDLCIELGMNGLSDSTGLESVLEFIRNLKEKSE